MTLRVYTDASYRQMDNLGSWAIISDQGWNRSGTIHNKEIDIAYMELYAVQQAIIQSIGYDDVHIYTDSDYVYTNLNIKAQSYEDEKWNVHKGNGFLTKKDLLRQTWKMYKNNPQIQIFKVKAHNGNEMNEKADQLAKQTLADNLHLLRVEAVAENSRLIEENMQLKSANDELYELLKQYQKTNNHLSELLADATREGYFPPLPADACGLNDKKYKVKDCPLNVIGFLKIKGLLKEDLLFSERLELEKEFYEWCDKS